MEPFLFPSLEVTPLKASLKLTTLSTNIPMQSNIFTSVLKLLKDNMHQYGEKSMLFVITQNFGVWTFIAACDTRMPGKDLLTV